MDRSTSPAGPTPASLLRAPMQLWLVALLMLVAFGAGFLVRPTPSPAASPSSQLAPVEAPLRRPIAPPLSDEQLEEAELPAGHPPLAPTTDDTTSLDDAEP